MKIIICIISVFLITLSKCQESKRAEESNLDPFTPIPYIVVNFEKDITLPDSLQLYGNGKAVIDLFIDNEGKIEGYNLKFIQLDSLKHFEYLAYPNISHNYPHSIKKFVPYFNEVIDKLEIKRDETVTINKKETYVISLSLNIN